MQIRKDVIKLTLPIFTEQVFITSMGMINTMMAGNIGKEVVSAIGMVDSLSNIIIACFSSLAVGGTVVVAHYAGQKNVKGANDSTKQALISTTIIALAVTLLIFVFKNFLVNSLFGSAEGAVLNNAKTYLGITLFTYPMVSILLTSCGVLRGSGDTKTPMKVTITMNAINVILSYFLIYGFELKNDHMHIYIPSLGVKGAAIGLAVARTFGAFAIFYTLLRGSRIIKLKNLNSFKFNAEILKSIYNVSVPASLESLLFNGGKLITQIFIVGLGTISIAANSVGGSIVSMLNVPGMALSIAATTIVGQNMGKGKSEEAKSSLLYLTKLTAISLTILGLASIPVAKFLSGLYTTNTDIINLSAKLLWMNALFMPLWSTSFVLPAGLKGAGDAKYTLVTSMAGMWLFRITLGYILAIPLKFGVAGIWLGMYTDWIVRGSLYYVRLQNGKWKKNVVVKASL